MPANHILPVLAIAFRAANPAGIQRDAPAIRLLDDHEPQGLAARIHGEKVHGSILHFANGHAHDVANGINRLSRWRRGICSRVNEISCQHENHG